MKKNNYQETSAQMYKNHEKPGYLENRAIPVENIFL